MRIPKILNDEAEKAVCRRVAEVRRSLGLSQSEFAKELGIGRDGLSSIEIGRAPLRFELGDKICSAMAVTPWWLAEGKEPREWPARIVIRANGPIPARMLFSAAYKQFLKPGFDLDGPPPITPEQKAEWQLDQIAGKESELIISLHRELLLPLIEFALNAYEDAGLPDHLRDVLRKGLAAVVKDFIERHISEISAARAVVPAGATAKNPHFDVDDSVNSAKVAGMASPFERLLVRLNEAAGAAGKKTELATFLNAPLESVSRWLSDKREPGGDVTLRMLQWVEAQEAKNKKRRRCYNTAGA